MHVSCGRFYRRPPPVRQDAVVCPAYARSALPITEPQIGVTYTRKGRRLPAGPCA
jgi:hypothetical protein